MISSKQRAYLRSLATKEDTILQLGKEGVTDAFVRSVDTAIAVRELVKFRVLESAPVTAREAAEQVAAALGAAVVTVVGRKAVLYRRSEENRLGL